jgi:signal transduction histidine kinase
MNPNILAVEDDRDTLANLQDILELDGYHVTGAGSFREAADRHSWADFAVILLDRRLPDGTADAMLPVIRSAAPQAAVIVMTGYADLESTIAALRAGAADYLLKPINPDLLRATVARVLKMRELESRMLQAERLAAIGQMITVLTHESGNALARCQLLLASLTEEVRDRPEALELIGQLQKAEDDLRRLYDEVRNYAAPIRLDRSPWDLGQIWRQAWANVMATKGQQKRAALEEQTCDVDLTCEVDSFRLDQVFRNLFENALAACPEPVRVEVACAEATLGDRPAVRVSVRDNGPGLAPDQRPKVFAPFYTTKKKGTGLGLAIVQRIVEAHGGEVAVGDGSRPGAEFHITLPRGATADA